VENAPPAKIPIQREKSYTTPTPTSGPTARRDLRGAQTPNSKNVFNSSVPT
jgi:hypothetical protein